MMEPIASKNTRHTLFSWSKQGGLNPWVIDKASGPYLYTNTGQRILDFSSQLMNTNIGHGHPAVLEAVRRQMEKLSFVAPNMATEVRGELGERLAQIAPGDLNRTLFTLGGSEAIENAIKLARVYTGKHKILCHYRSYHGATYGAITASGDPRRHQVDAQGLPHIVHFENPYFYRCPWNSSSPEECARLALRNLENIIHYENPDTIAAILIEGESGTSGCIKYPRGYWKMIVELAQKYNILTIDDEVMSGFCRTGEWFAIEHHGVSPDIMCMAKGLTSGYIPLGGMIVSEKIASHFEDKVLPLGLTYSAHAVGCAAALAVLDVYEKEGLMQKARERGRYIDQRMEQLIQKHPSIGDWRNTGMLGCLELVRNRETKEPIAPYNAGPQDLEITNKVAAKLRELGMFTFVKWSYVFVAPPLNIEEAQIDEGIDILSEAISISDEYYTG